MLLPTLLSIALALPALSAPLTSRSTESWSITTLDVHFMGRDTGIPGNTWPEDRKFNTTLDFTLETPNAEVQCSANWKYQEVSTAEWACGDATGVSFHLSPTPAGVLADASWTLTITKDSDAGVFVASQAIENNNAGASNSYLTCIGGAPFDGIRCKLNGWAGKPGPIVLTATSQ